MMLMPITVFSPHEPDPIVPAGFDERLRPVLDILPFSYRINAYGSVEIDVDHAGQEITVTLMSWTVTLGYLEVREVIALGGYAPGPLDAGFATLLLEQNHRVKLGAWRLLPSPSRADQVNHHAVSFAARIPVNLDPEHWIRVITLVAGVVADFRRQFVASS